MQHCCLHPESFETDPLWPYNPDTADAQSLCSALLPSPTLLALDTTYTSHCASSDSSRLRQSRHALRLTLTTTIQRHPQPNPRLQCSTLSVSRSDVRSDPRPHFSFFYIQKYQDNKTCRLVHNPKRTPSGLSRARAPFVPQRLLRPSRPQSGRQPMSLPSLPETPFNR